jgi:hypothetical protein
LTAEIWREAKKRARAAKCRKAAIAYVTRDLIGLRAGDTLITDASERAVRAGQTDALLLRKLHDDGVTIYSHEGLHSKVILLGKHAIIGSANMSGSDLTEVSIITDSPTITSGIASFIAQLSTARSELNARRIAMLCRIKVVRNSWHNTKRITKRKRVRRLGNATWIIGVNTGLPDPPAKEQRLIDRAHRELNERLGTDDQYFNWIKWGKRSRFSRECREGDTLIEISNQKGRKRRVVTRRIPVLLKRTEPNCFRYYIGDPQRASDEVTWSRFQRILKEVEYSREVRPYSVQLLDSEIAAVIDQKWTRVR